MVYWLTIHFARTFLRLFTCLRVSGKERVPKTGSFVLVSNHISHFDPPIFTAVCPRNIDWMGSEILFRGTITRFYFQQCNVIKVRQYEADQGALREAIRHVKKGRCVGLFPEGGIRAGETGILGGHCKLYEGAFMIAVLERVPIVPCLIMGSDRLYNPASLLRRPPIWVRFGKPIEVIGEGTDEIHRLRDETVKSIRQLVSELRAEGKFCKEDWPQTPQQRNPKIPAPVAIRKIL